MGYHNACAALQARDISMAARYALMVMALTSLDADAKHQGVPDLYWAGHQHLAMCLGYPKWDHTAKERVRRAVLELKAAGYVEPLHHHPRGQQVYRLHLGPPASGP